nr:reverse transcriptase domain-containing protein [Rhodococcus rhodochrous]
MGGSARGSSYGFRPGRGCADAIQSLFLTLKGSRSRRVWILDADLTAAFDKIDHPRLLDKLGSFPAREWSGSGLRPGWPRTVGSRRPRRVLPRAV